MQDMKQLQAMGLMDPSEVEKFREAIDQAPPGEELKVIKRLLDPVKDHEGLRNIAARLNAEFSQPQVPKHRKEPLAKNKAKRQRAKA